MLADKLHEFKHGGFKNKFLKGYRGIFEVGLQAMIQVIDHENHRETKPVVLQWGSLDFQTHRWNG